VSFRQVPSESGRIPMECTTKDELSRGSDLGYKILIGFGFGLP
jgi:hypothetical protein